MKKVLSIALAVVFGCSLNAQELEKHKVKHKPMGTKKFNNAEKKIFLQDFFVNYQMVFDQVEIARGGREVGGGYRGDAKAELVLAVKGVKPEILQAVTDDVYKQYITKLEAKGFKVITAADIRPERFSESKILEGGSPYAGTFPGYVSTAPTGFQFFEAKRSIFGTGLKLSKENDGLIIARVNASFTFTKDAESTLSKGLAKTLGGVAKIKVRPELSLVPRMSYETKNKLGMKIYKSVGSASAFAYKKSLKYQAALSSVLSKPIIVSGVFEDKKYKASASAQQDLWGAQRGALRVFNADDTYVNKAQPVPCEEEKYKKGVTMALESFVIGSVDEFLSDIK